MKHNYTILIMGNLNDNHLLRFTKHLKACNPDVRMDYFGFCDRLDNVPKNNLKCFDSCCINHTPTLFNKIPLVRSIVTIITWKIQFRKFVRNRKYDIANIHFVTYHYYSIIKRLKKHADSIVLTPWGSDVYRIKDLERKIVHRIYDQADYVTGHGDRFSDDFMQIYNVEKDRFKNVSLGSETIDYIYDHFQSTNTDDAKKVLGIENCYAITCGYNASKSQRHKAMIEAIAKIKDQLPENLILLFPLTYPKDIEYKGEIKKLVESYGLNARYYEDYLDMNTLFMLRQATDMFIHIQTTDANNASLKEYLLCKKNVINGAWLTYYDVEEDNYKPYYIVEDVSSLSNVILQAYKGVPIEIKDSVIQTICSMGCREVAKEWNKLFESIC